MNIATADFDDDEQKLEMDERTAKRLLQQKDAPLHPINDPNADIEGELFDSLKHLDAPILKADKSDKPV